MTRRIACYFELVAWALLIPALPAIAWTLVRLPLALVDLRLLFFLAPSVWLSAGLVLNAAIFIPAYRRVAAEGLRPPVERLVWAATLVVHAVLVPAAAALMLAMSGDKRSIHGWYGIGVEPFDSLYRRIPGSLGLVALAAVWVIDVTLAAFALTAPRLAGLWSFAFGLLASVFALLFAFGAALEIDSRALFWVILPAGWVTVGVALDRGLRYLTGVGPRPRAVAAAAVAAGAALAVPSFATLYSGLLPRFAREGNRNGVRVLTAAGAHLVGESPRYSPTLRAIAAREGHTRLFAELSGRRLEEPGWRGRKQLEDLIRSRALGPRNEAAIAVLFARDERTALLAASGHDLPEVVELLLAAGVDGRDGLVRAARMGNVRVVRALLQRGAPPDAADPATGETPLIAATAAQAGEPVEVVRELLRAGAAVDARDRSGATALIVGQRRLPPYRAGPVTRLLLEVGADVNATDAEGRRALDHASGEAANLILAAGGRRSARRP